MMSEHTSSCASGPHARTRLWASVALGAAILLTATGCAPEADATDASSGTTQSPSATPKPTKTPTKTPATPAPTTEQPAAPIVLPACADLVTEQQARELGGQDSYVLLDDEVVASMSDFLTQNTLGAAANAALGGASQTVSCGWGIPNSGAYTQAYASVLDPAVQSALRTELDASDFVRGTEGSATTYALAIPGGIANHFVWYAFDGDVWVAEIGVIEQPGFGRAVLASVQAANPNGLAQ